MTKAAKKNQADLRELVAALQGELDALRAKVAEAGKAPPEAPDEPRSQYENDDQSELATLRARLAKLEANEKGVVAPIELDIEVSKPIGEISMAEAAKKNQADLRELVAAQQRGLDALRAKVEGTPEAGKAPPEAPDEPRSQYENDDQSELATLRARLAKLEANEKGVVAPIEIDTEVLKSVLAMTEKDAQQIIEQTKRAMINVLDEITLKDVTLKNQTITVPAPTNLSEGLLVVIDLINKHGGKIITLAYDVKTNAQGLYLKLRGAAEQKKFRQQEE